MPYLYDVWTCFLFTLAQTDLSWLSTLAFLSTHVNCWEIVVIFPLARFSRFSRACRNRASAEKGEQPSTLTREPAFFARKLILFLRTLSLRSFHVRKKLRSTGIYLWMHENSYRNVNSFLTDRFWHTIRKLTKINSPPLFSLNLNSFNSIKSPLLTSKWHSKWKWHIHEKFKLEICFCLFLKLKMHRFINKPAASWYRIYQGKMHTFFYKNKHQNRGAYYTRILLFVKQILICIR